MITAVVGVAALGGYLLLALTIGRCLRASSRLNQPPKEGSR